MVLDNVVKEITDTWPWNVCKTADTHTTHVMTLSKQNLIKNPEFVFHLNLMYFF